MAGLLCPDIMAFDIPNAQDVKQYDKKHGITDEHRQIHREVWIVGAHSPAHERVGKDIIVPGRSGGESGESAEERQADRDGKASDYERQETLHRAYSSTANDAADKPFDQCKWDWLGETDIQTT